MGLVGYYRRFVRHYGLISNPLTEVLKKGNFHWSEDAKKTFNQLKAILVTALVLALPDLQKAFVVETDALSTGIGVVLMQNMHHVVFINKTLSLKNQLLSVYDCYSIYSL